MAHDKVIEDARPSKKRRVVESDNESGSEGQVGACDLLETYG